MPDQFRKKFNKLGSINIRSLNPASVKNEDLNNNNWENKIAHNRLVIDKLCSPALIGLDVFKKFKTIVNFDNNTLTFKR